MTNSIKFAKNTSKKITCTLTSPEFQKRKKTVLNNLKVGITEKEDLENGLAFKFSGTDDSLFQLTEFIITERKCCPFFTFNLSVSGDQQEIWLSLTGPEGVKAFITNELGFC